MLCKNLQEQVVIEQSSDFNGIYKTNNYITDSSYSYYRPPSETDQYNTHFTVFPTGSGNATFETFHISLNFAAPRGIRNAKIWYRKGIFESIDDKNLTQAEKVQFQALLDEKRKEFDEMALQFWTKVQEEGTHLSLLTKHGDYKTHRSHIRRIKQKIEDELLSRPGITGVDIDYKVSNGVKSNNLAIIVFVEKKKKDIPKNERIPKHIEGIPTDIWEGSFSTHSTFGGTLVQPTPLNTQDFPADPLIGGVSVGPCDLDNSGTLGIVSENTYGMKLILSCHHVLASSPHTVRGMPISQPALPYGGQCPNTQAGSFFMGFMGQPENIDAALATVHRNAQTNEILHIGQTTGITNIPVGINVAKFGRATHFTTGRVVSTNFTCTLDDPNFGQHTYYNQLRIQADNPTQHFSQPGDSGAMVINENKQIGGMVIGGGEADNVFYTIANPIEDIINVFAANGIHF